MRNLELEFRLECAKGIGLFTQEHYIKWLEDKLEKQIADVMHCLSSEIEEMHYQSRDRKRCYLQQLLFETKQKGNLAEELISALEIYLNK